MTTKDMSKDIDILQYIGGMGVYQVVYIAHWGNSNHKQLSILFGTNFFSVSAQVVFFFMLAASMFLGSIDSIMMNFIGGFQEHWCNVPQLANFR